MPEKSRSSECEPVQCPKCSSYSHSVVEITPIYARCRCADCGTIHDYRRLADEDDLEEDFGPTNGKTNGDHRAHVRPAPAPKIGFLRSAVETAIAAGPAGIRQAQRVALKYAKKYQDEAVDYWRKETVSQRNGVTVETASIARAIRACMATAILGCPFDDQFGTAVSSLCPD